MATVRHLAFVWGILGPPRKLLDNLYHYAKFGCNRYSSFDNMKVSIFGAFGLKPPVHAPKLEFFWTIWPLNGMQYQRNPEKGLRGGPIMPQTNPRWRTVAILKNLKSWNLKNCLTAFDLIWHSDASWPFGPWQPIKFREFKNPWCRTPSFWKWNNATYPC